MSERGGSALLALAVRAAAAQGRAYPPHLQDSPRAYLNWMDLSSVLAWSAAMLEGEGG